MENHYRKALHGKTFNYSIEEYPFKALLTSLYGCELESIHQYIGDMDTFDQANDQKTLIHKVFYSNFERLIEPLYIKFIKNIIGPIIKVPFYYQKIPTFRIGLPGNKFVGEFHKDSKYNHQGYEVNFNLGICGYTGEAALQVEESEGSNKFYTLECPYGKIFSFDHISCLHGSNPNPSNLTMISFDFRLAIESLYFVSDKSSINMKTKFIKGSYFSDEYVSF